MSEVDGVSLIKENISIAEFIGRYVTLKRKGTRLTACCPFHQEKSPSFNVDAQKGFFHCFGCGAGGDLIKFAMDIEGLSFVEALEFLADIAGVELPKRNRSGPSRDVVEALREINHEATLFYHQQLRKNDNAKKYLNDRGIRDSTINLFKLGYATNQWDGLLNHLSQKFDQKFLEQSGLFKISKKGTPYDIFRDGVILPICDTHGNHIAFGGRLIGEEEGPKYINSPETPIYTKGKHLYNLNFAKQFLKKEAEIVVVEGYMDAIQVYQAGVGNVIASLGTAFTPEQAKLIKRHTDKVILNFDGDKAGFKAARVSIETCLHKDLEIGVVTLPNNQDPDDYIKEHGVDGYRGQLDQAISFYDFLTDYLSEGQDLSQDPRKMSFVTQEISQTLHYISDPVVRGFYVEKLSTDLRVPQNVVQQIMSGQKVEVTHENRRVQRKPLNRQEQGRFVFAEAEEEFLFHVIHNPNYLSLLDKEQQEALPQITQQLFQQVPEILNFIYYTESDDFSQRLDQVKNEELRRKLREIYFEEAHQNHDEERLKHLFPEVMRRMLERLVINLRTRIRLLPPGDETRNQMRKQVTNLTREIHKLKTN